MGNILSAAELDLLNESSIENQERRQHDSRTSPIARYDFRRPDRISKEQIRALHLLHDRFARNATTSLAAYLRAITELSVVSVEQFSYAEFLLSLPDPTAFYALAMEGFDALAALELSPSIAFTIVDRMLGGTGQSGTPERALTEIEQNVVDSIVKLILEHLTETWRGVAQMAFHIHGRETRPQMLQVAGRNEVVILFVFDIKVGDVRGMMHICIPASVIEATGSTFVQGRQSARREPTVTERNWLAENLGRLELPIAPILESRLPARELLDLTPGQVLRLGVPVTSPLDIRVGTSLKFHGRLVLADSRAAVVIQGVREASAEGAK
ncbi:MAG TPA: flagellar motor switch protein FliM [Vicinamibacterales bacterium]|nr:flagellar motor switch protein FliM [Vicinamibacterales bacterium]